MILESSLVTATTADIMNSGRLTNIPYNGQLSLGFTASVCDADNNWRLKIQLPNGDVPIDGQLITAHRESKAGVMNSEDLMQFTFPATQGGHFTVGVTLTGTSILTYRFVLVP